MYGIKREEIILKQNNLNIIAFFTKLDCNINNAFLNFPFFHNQHF